MRSWFSRKGFTLVEVIIVIGITTVLAGLILTYTSDSRDQVAMYVEEAKLAQTISRAKALSITTFNQPGGRAEIPCGYGVFFNYDAQTYNLFSYKTPKCVFAQSLDLSEMEEGDCTIGVPACSISSAVLPRNVKLFFEGKEDSIDTVFFIPPDPKTWVWNKDAISTSTSGRVYLSTSKTNVSVYVGPGGQISF
jgi:prepilin-type N-terminal cleavage/methylation domain-containing protein